MRTITTVLLALMMATVGLCQAQEAPAQPEADGADEADGQVVMMRAVWPEGDLTNTSFRVFTDQQMRVLLDVFPAPEGTAMTVLPPGEYYAMAVVDANGNNQVDAGDGFGFHGVSDLSGESRPSALKVEAGRLNQITIPILMVRSEDGRLLPLPSALQATTGTVSGRVTGITEAAGPVLVVALPIGMQTRPVVTVVGFEGRFELEVPAGSHMLVALADADSSGTLTDADLVATIGSEDAPVSVEADRSSALAQPLELAAEHIPPEGIPPLVAGRVSGAEIPEGGRASIAFCTDPQLRNQAFSVETTADGRYAALAELGTYYVRATIDAADDGALGAGDMLGFFGVDDLLGGATPAALEIGEYALRTDVDVPITANIDETGRLQRRSASEDQDEATTAPGNAGE